MTNYAKYLLRQIEAKSQFMGGGLLTRGQVPIDFESHLAGTRKMTRKKHNLYAFIDADRPEFEDDGPYMVLHFTTEETRFTGDVNGHIDPELDGPVGGCIHEKMNVFSNLRGLYEWLLESTAWDLEAMGNDPDALYVGISAECKGSYKEHEKFFHDISSAYEKKEGVHKLNELLERHSNLHHNTNRMHVVKIKDANEAAEIVMKYPRGYDFQTALQIQLQPIFDEVIGGKFN